MFGCVEISVMEKSKRLMIKIDEQSELLYSIKSRDNYYIISYLR